MSIDVVVVTSKDAEGLGGAGGGPFEPPGVSVLNVSSLYRAGRSGFFLE